MCQHCKGQPDAHLLRHLLCPQVGFGGFAMRNLSKRLMTAYFNSNPALYSEIFGFSM
jgi:hypothetical protein